MFNDQEKHEGGITTMAQVNLTLNQEEILQLLSSGNRSEAFKELLTKSLNQFLAIESANQLGAKPYERTDDDDPEHKRSPVHLGIRLQQTPLLIGHVIENQ